MTEFDDITIPRNLVKVGLVTRNATFCREGMGANKALDGKEIDLLPFYVNDMVDYKKIRGILFGVDQDKMAIDLINNTLIDYPVMNITPELSKIQKRLNGFAVSDNYSLETLLEYLDFPEEMTVYELRKLRDILISKKQLRKLALPCCYGKINIWKTNILDYQQEVKLGLGEYYKFIGEGKHENDRCVFDKNVPDLIFQQIYPKDLFKLLVQNQKLGYTITDKEENDVVQKRLVI